MTDDWVEFTWDGRDVQGLEGEPIAAALWRAGILTQTRSIKYHRARGPQCMTGGCPGCLVRVDGIPNLRGCRTPVAPGCQVESQVGRPTAERDLLAIVDGLMPHLDHERDFVRPAPVRAVYEAIARRLAGFGRLPDRIPEAAEGRTRSCDLLIAGAGPAGLAAAHVAGRSGLEVLMVDPEKPGGSLLHTPRPVEGGRFGTSPGPELARALTETLPETVERVQGAVFGLYEEATAVLAHEDGLARVDQVTAGTMLLACGAREGIELVPGNDRPGVLGARAARILLNRHGVRPGERLAVVDPGQQGRWLAEEARARGIETVVVEKAREIGGDPAVAWVATSTERVPADAVALDPGLEPAVELAQQAGIPLTYQAPLGGRVPLHQPDGATPVPGVLVAGSVAGLHTPAAALAQGRMAGARAAGKTPERSDKELVGLAGLAAEAEASLREVWQA